MCPYALRYAALELRSPRSGIMHARKLQQMYQRTRIPMPIIAEIAQTMHDVLTNEAEQAGRDRGFVQRHA